METLGQRIRRLREADGRSQETLAGDVGCSRATLLDIELDRVNPELGTLNGIAYELGMTCSGLLEGFEFAELPKPRSAQIRAERTRVPAALSR